ncbi:MAG: GNAT family N-acetyltransferase [Anaerolineales bacterium]
MALKGDLVILREQRREDMQYLVDLRNDPETQAWSKSLPPDYTLEMYLKRFEGREFSLDRQDGQFTVVTKDTDEFAGLISYTDLQPRFSATIGIIIARRYWGGGVAYDAQEVLLRFLFEGLGLRVVRLWTHSGNPRAVKLAEKSGFRVSMRMREAIWKDGQLLDNLSMDLLREEYYALHPELTDNLPEI